MTSRFSTGGLNLDWSQKMPQVMEVLATKFQGLGCFRTWEITILVKSRDQWRHTFHWGVQGVGAGSKKFSCPSSPTYQVWWRMYFYMLRYLHFLAKIGYFAICICTSERNGGITPKSSIASSVAFDLQKLYLKTVYATSLWKSKYWSNISNIYLIFIVFI